MPTIPLYSQYATDDLNRAKRRIIEAEESGIAQLTFKPIFDLSDGGADKIVDELLKLFEKLKLRLFDIRIEARRADDDVGGVPLEITDLLPNIERAVADSNKIVKLAGKLVNDIQYASLSKIEDLKRVLRETNTEKDDMVRNVAQAGILGIFDRRQTHPLQQNFLKFNFIFEEGFRVYNEARKQQVFPTREEREAKQEKLEGGNSAIPLYSLRYLKRYV